MVVLSRPRSSGQKGGPRLSVPPPLNLPSLRKEHERFDLSTAAGRSAGASSSGVGAGHGVSAMGWTRPAVPPPLAAQEEGAATAGLNRMGRSGVVNQNGVGSTGFAPPGLLSAGHQPSATSGGLLSSDSDLALRREDFPSLSATFEASKKQKDGMNQKQKQKPESEELSDLKVEKTNLGSPFYMRPHLRTSRLVDEKGSNADGGGGRSSVGRQSLQKRDAFLPGPLSLPLMHLGQTSDWADDERDTGLRIPDRERGRGLPRADPGRYDDHLEGRGSRHSELGSVTPREFLRDSYGRDVATPSREGCDVSSWRAFPPSREGLATREPGTDRGSTGRPLGSNREIGKVSAKYVQPPHGDGVSIGSQDPSFSRRELGTGHSTQTGRTGPESFIGRDADRKMQGSYSDVYNNRSRGDVFQSITASSAPFSSGIKGYPASDPILNFARGRRIFSNSNKPYTEDAGFDSRDPFLGSFSGDVNTKVYKKKKDSMKQVDFHDPARESFEAELERVQQLQELERQRVLEEQARVLELARKEEEERERLAREEEERRRKFEEEAREAAWRAEQERLEAAKRAEEQKIAREEEKMRIILEEERRKEAARQKLLELEARIARRQAEATANDDRYPAARGDEGMPNIVKEKSDLDAHRITDVGGWEDGEMMVENITSSSDSASMNRYFETGYRPQSSRDGNSSFNEKGKLPNSWRRDANLNSKTVSIQDQDSGFHSPKRDAFGTERLFPKRDIHGSPGAMTLRPTFRGVSEQLHLLDDSRHSREQRWNITTEAGDHFTKSSDVDAEIVENDKFGDVGWRHNHSSSSIHTPYPDKIFQNTEVDGFSSFGRSRHSLRQPRVLPPPFSSLHRSPFRVAPEHPSSSTFSENEARYQNGKVDEEILQMGYEDGFHEKFRKPVNVASSEQLTISLEPEVEKTRPRCDSQSSLSVTSPPGSPTHLSHDDLDESGDSLSMPASAHGEQLTFSESEHVSPEREAGLTNMKMSSSSVFPGEEDEWAIENNEEIQDQEEYDEDDSYQEEEEAHDGDDEKLDLVQEFEELHSGIQNVTEQIDQLVLDSDEGVQVCIHDNSEFERPAETPKKEMGRQMDLVSGMDDSGFVEDLIGHHEAHARASNGLPEGIREITSKVTVETDKAMQDMVIEPVLSASYLVEDVPVAASLTSSSSPSLTQPIVSSVSTTPIQSEVPVKFQFGLFSGPSLMPSPVPAIQIGSIQMPLHLHPPVGPSLTQVPQPPFFQFGQMRYSSPIPQGMLPLSLQNMPFVHPTIPAQCSLSHNCGSSLHSQVFQDSSVQTVPSKEDALPAQINNQLSPMSPICDLPRENLHLKVLNVFSDTLKNEVSQAGNSSFCENKNDSELISQLEQQSAPDVSPMKDHQLPINNRESQSQILGQHTSSLLLSEDKVLSGTKYLPASVSRGKRYVYKVKNSGSRSLLPAPEPLCLESSNLQRKPRRNIQRTEFRARESGRRQSEALESSSYTVVNERPGFSGRESVIPSRNVVKKVAFLNKSNRSMVDSERSISGLSGSRPVISDSKMGKTLGKEASSKRNISAVDKLHPTMGNLKRNVNSEEDIDAPLQSGIVRVFKQSGIEIPSDEDDFIEVRSKRQMLNDRREQREKENKAKSRAIKTSRKPRSAAHNNAFVSNSNKVGTSLGDAANGVGSISVVADPTGFVGHEPPTVIVASQPLAPIGTPAMIGVDTDIRSHTMKSTPTVCVPVVSAGGTNLTAGLPFEKNNVAMDHDPTSLGSWNKEHTSQQVISLTRTQVDESMKSPHFDAHVTSIGHHHGIVIEQGNLSPSIQSPEKSYSSSTSSLKPVFPGERIQFGAVTSPTILPPVSRAISRMSVPDKGCPMFFEKAKHPTGSSVHLDDPEAEAAASAVAVAAISNDEAVGSSLGDCAVPVSDTKKFDGNHEVTGQSTGEESLTVTLPADLSVETPSISLWPTLPSPQSSGPMISHFPGAPPSHFPCFEMNPMLGGPIFAFGPNDESVGMQSQSQRSTALGTGPLGTWPACHSGVDSFYGPPAGFTGPFISPPVGIPGVQGPPHMVVYNHFTPVGQFGQLGLGFMGATYIPSGKQPDWKHNSMSPNVAVSEGDSNNNINVVSGQQTPGMPSPLQHLAPGSPLMPMASPLTMFDMSPFQSADIPVQARWSHLPAPPPLHSVPLSVPLQQYQVDGVTQFSHGSTSDISTANSRFHEPRSSMPLDGSRGFAASSDAAPQFPDELGLVETPRTITSTVQISRPNTYSSSPGNNGKGLNAARGLTRDTMVGSAECGGIGTTSSPSNRQSVGSAIKPLAAQPLTSSTQQYLQTIGYSDQKSGGSSTQKVGSGGGEWYRRTGFQGKIQTSGSDKNFATAKMKQIYVAKPPSNGIAPSNN